MKHRHRSRRSVRSVSVGLAALLVAMGLADGTRAQNPPPPAQAPPAAPAAENQAPAPAPFKPEELEQIAAPIALYPDPLLAQIFMAATYPLEVVQAARFMKDHPNLKEAQLDEELKKQTWDDSVKSLCTFPPVLSMMNEKLDWTQKLGDAVLAQQADLMSAVQRLRAKAQAEGSLKDTKEQKVTVEVVTPPPAPSQAAPPAPTQVIKIEPADPQVIYVPQYNPTVVYGGWPYPAYPPYAYYPPGYVAGTALLSFGVGMAVGAAVWGNCNWGGGDVNINNNNYNNFTKNVNNQQVAAKRQEMQNQRASGQGGQGNRSSWQHNPENRKGVQYRDQATQQKFNRGDSPNAASREQFRGRDQGGAQRTGAQGGAGAGGQRGQGGGPGGQGGGLGGQGGGGLGGQGGGGIGQGGAGAGGQRGQGGGGFSGGGAGGGRAQQTGGSGAFDRSGSGSQTRASSDRGSASRQSMGGGGGGARAGGGGGGGGARSGGGGGGARGGGGGGRR